MVVGLLGLAEAGEGQFRGLDVELDLLGIHIGYVDGDEDVVLFRFCFARALCPSDCRCILVSGGVCGEACLPTLWCDLLGVPLRIGGVLGLRRHDCDGFQRGAGESGGVSMNRMAAGTVKAV